MSGLVDDERAASAAPTESRDRRRVDRRRRPSFIVVPAARTNDERVACLVDQAASSHDDARPRRSRCTSSSRSTTVRRASPGSRPLAILNDVEMGVTAELGRRRMTVRDLLALTPGSVIELDRAAGSPGRRARERHADRGTARSS